MVNLFEEIERLKREKSEILEVLKELEESSTIIQTFRNDFIPTFNNYFSWLLDSDAYALS